MAREATLLERAFTSLLSQLGECEIIPTLLVRKLRRVSDLLKATWKVKGRPGTRSAKPPGADTTGIN